MITSSFKPLIQQMKQRKPVLLLGAGFSYGAINANGESVKMGNSLAEALFSHFYEDGGILSKIPGDTKKEIEQHKKDLKEICSYLRIQHMSQERDDFLVKEFSGCTLKEDASQRNIVDYPWSYIFTLNIDDLVENIYKKADLPIYVWDLSHPHGNDNPNIPNLIKLHGSIHDKDSGFIFDQDEYRYYTIDSNSLLREFAHQVVNHDLIMVGTEFQEEDLLSILSVYENCGYDIGSYKRFYITPSISNVGLKLKIENQPNDIWIQATTDAFMQALHNSITVPTGKRQALKERGVYYISDVNRQTPSSMGIYKGEDSVYADFFHDKDIIRPDIALLSARIVRGERRQIISLFGDSYIGKTCCAKRLLVDLDKAGYDAIKINYLDNQIVALLVDYWATLDYGSNVAVYIERASFSYHEVLKLKKGCPLNINQLVLITEDTVDNHNSKRYILLTEAGFSEYEIVPTMNADIAFAIYDKLSKQNRLGHYLDFLPDKSNVFSRKSRDTLLPQIMKEQDIIDALYFASEGRSFRKHYESWLKNNAKDDEFKLLVQICCFGQLGIDRIPTILFDRIGRKQLSGFNLKEYVKKYNEIIKREGSFVVFRRGRILNELIKTKDNALVLSLLRDVAMFCVPANEYDQSEWGAIFQKALSVKRIKKRYILTNDHIYELLRSLERYCSHISYYWVQYGIAAQNLDNFEDANNHLLYAKNMRPNSYQVRHALAKNNLEWGLFLIRSGDDEAGTEKFNSGETELLDLINNKSYSDSYRYSVHTMVNMDLQYYSIKHEMMSQEKCIEITSILEVLLHRPLDNMLIALIKNYISYCDNHGLSVYCNNLRGVNHRYEAIRADASTYDLD